MHVAELTIIQARVRLKFPVSHASFSRTSNDTLLVRCRLSTGEVGWGEGLPRPYVTGETFEAAWDLLHAADLNSLKQHCGNLQDVVHMLDGFHLPQVPGQRDCYGHAARCAVELAVLDACCRAVQRPLRDVVHCVEGAQAIAGEQKQVRYSGVIPSTTLFRAGALAAAYRCAGFRDCKVKVGATGIDDDRLLRKVRRWTGQGMDLRVDANESWSAENVSERIERLLPHNISSVEQPVPHAEVNCLENVRRQVAVPIMLDESLCSLQDGRRAIEEGLADLFNLRLSKCGGFIPSVRLALLAAQAGLGCQLGCQVGETGILTAAGRHFATGISDLLHIEGSFDGFLVWDRLTREDLTLGWGGWAKALDGSGLGVTIAEKAVRQVSERQRVIFSQRV